VSRSQKCNFNHDCILLLQYYFILFFQTNLSYMSQDEIASEMGCKEQQQLFFCSIISYNTSLLITWVGGGSFCADAHSLSSHLEVNFILQ